MVSDSRRINLDVRNKSYFGQRLVERGLITRQQLGEALRIQRTRMPNEKIGNILFTLGFVNKQTIIQLIAEQLRVPLANLANRDIPPDVIATVPAPVAEKYRVVPLALSDKGLLLAMCDPTVTAIVGELSNLLCLPVRPAIATPEEIHAGLAKYYNVTS